MGPFDLLKESLGRVKDAIVAEVLRERLTFAEEKFKEVESKKKELEAEVQRLTVALQAKTLDCETLEKKLANVPVATVPPKDPYKEECGCARFANDPQLYCIKCYEEKGKKYPARGGPLHSWKCTVCGNTIFTR